MMPKNLNATIKKPEAMSNFHFSPLLVLLLFSLFIMACEDQEPTQMESTAISNRIENRSPDPGCEVCDNLLVDHCCCFVESRELSGPIEMHVCGVLAPTNESCSMSTGLGCYNIGTNGITRTLNYLDRIYFCVGPNSSFTLYNANGSGDGRVVYGCSGNNMPAGDIGLNLSYSNGSYIANIPNTSCEVDYPCPN